MLKGTSTCFIMLVLQMWRRAKSVWVKYISFHYISLQWLRQEALKFLAYFLSQKGIKCVCTINLLKPTGYVHQQI